MRISFGVILVSGICGGLLSRSASALPVTLQHRITSREVEEQAEGMFNIFDTSLSSNAQILKNDVRSRKHHSSILLANLEPIIRSPQSKESAYIMVKSMRQQRDKREEKRAENLEEKREEKYFRYLTFCHFKICNMGRKRTTRFLHVIRRMDETENNQ